MKYIIKSHLKNELIHKLFNENKSNSLFNIEILSLNQFMINILEYKELNIFDLYQELKKLELKDLKISLEDQNFLNKLISDRYKLAAYDVDIDELDIHEEYKLLLKNIKTIDFYKLYDYINSHDFSDYQIYDLNYTIFENKIIKMMVDKGAKLVNFNKYESNSQKIKVNNMKEGLMVVYDTIRDKNLDLNNIAIYANENDFNLIKAISDTMNVKLDINSTYLDNKINKLICILDLYLDFSIDNYYKLVNTNLFKAYNLVSFEEYLFNHANDITKEFNRFENDKDNDDLKYYYYLEKEANFTHLKYLELINKLKNSNYEEMLIYAFDLIKDNQKNTFSIKKIIEKYHDINAYPFLRTELLKIKEKTNGISVHTYKEEILEKDFIFCISPDFNIYPAFKAFNGFIKENDLINTNYPSLKERYDNHLNSFNYLFQNKNALFILVDSDISAKKKTYHGIFNDLNDFDYEIKRNNFKLSPKYNRTLNKDIANELFFKDNTLKGSISSFENYFSCPYSYFLKYGLKLYDKRKIELNAATTGTIIHALFEEAINLYHDDYYLHLEEHIDILLKKHQDLLLKIYEGQDNLIKLITKRIKNSVLLELDYIKKMEENTFYRPKEVEKSFDIDYLYAHGINLKIKGFIDRIDTSENNFRILDYKTSAHSLKVNDIKRGLQLQLLTYALVYHKLENLEPSGVFYLNVNHPSSKIKAYSFSKTSGIKRTLYSEEEIKEDFINSHKLDGMFFKDDEFLDKTRDNIKGYTKNGISKKNLINLDETKLLLDDIYANLIQKLQEGEIYIRPDDKRCGFCSFHKICHFNGLSNLNPVISDINILEGEKDETE